ncbi:MAG TPA: hypothetical protein VEV18_04305 [Steroidobacteraceae bacterium]|nr:hypothetical protein [Steroidobacteraceae bacterium]
MKTRMAMACFGAVSALVITTTQAAVELNDKTDITMSVFVPCAAGGAGEVVDLSGPLHSLISVTINGNNVSGITHFQPQGISGTGETTGTKYQGTGVTSMSFTASLQNGQVSTTFVNNFRIIGQGPGDNLLLHETAHLTVNADGTLTVTHDNLGIDCK